MCICCTVFFIRYSNISAVFGEIALGFPYIIIYAYVSNRMQILDPSVVDVAHSQSTYVGTGVGWAYWGLGRMEAFFFYHFFEKKILIQVCDNFTHKRKTIACF